MFIFFMSDYDETKDKQECIIVPDYDNTRNRTGMKNVFWDNLSAGQRLTIKEAIQLLIDKWQ